jgi:hypothetical protein
MSVPSVARGVLCIDFDGTLFPWEPLDGKSPPMLNAVETVNAFVKAGYNIVIFTSRMSETWWRAEIPRADGMSIFDWQHQYRAFGLEQLKLVENRLRNFNIPYDRITAEKVPAEFYIDDRAIPYEGDWSAIQQRVLGGPIGNPA